MSLSSEDLDDSALFYKSLVQKRKATTNVNPKNPKQLKLNFPVKTVKGNQVNDESGSKSVGEENGNCNGNEIGVLSSYFQPKKALNICPVCTKSFKTDSAYSTHMKQCAKSHKMTTQQLLGALELQKKQMQQRRDLGLPSQLIPSAKKTTSKKREERERDSYDLALGLALSKSLNSDQSSTSEVQKSTLQQFGITSSHIGEPCKKKKNGSKKSTLRTRTAEDRQKIIVEKLGVILLDEVQEVISGSTKPNSNSSFQSDQLASLVNMGQQLWSLAENDEKLDRYVGGIKTRTLSTEESEKDKEESILSGILESEISKLNLPGEEVHNSWKKMINCSEMSDVCGRTKDGRDFYLHTVVLFARFPAILNKDYESVFGKYNLSTVLVFLEYLYCGTLNGLIREEVQNLHDLAIELNYLDLMEILNRIKSNLPKCNSLSYSTEPCNSETEEKYRERTEVESRKPEFFERDLFAEEDVVDLTQGSNEYAPNEKSGHTSDTESYTEKCYKDFLQREKEIGELDEMKLEEREEKTEGRTSVETRSETMEILGGMEETKDKEPNEEFPSEKIQDKPRRDSDGSATRDLDVDEFKMKNTWKSSECIVLSSDSESRDSLTKNSPKNSPGKCSRSPTPFDNYEIPYFDPYDNFHCFSEEQYSPVPMHSQSLITGDISSEPVRRSPEAIPETPKETVGNLQEEPRKMAEYCSTPVTIRPSFGILQEEPKINSEYCSTPLTMRPSSRVKSSTKGKSAKSRKSRSGLSSSRILRKSLGLEFKARNKKSGAFQRKSAAKRENVKKKDFAEVLTDSILNELSKSVTLKSSTPVGERNFVEITPIPGRDEFGESVTPSPNYSNMEEKLLHEQLSKYGLKKSLGKTKARKILRLIYEELHPFYNTETGKIVKILTSNTPKIKKKAKPKAKPPNKKVMPKRNKECGSKKSKDKEVNSSQESVTLSEGSNGTLERANSYDTSGSDFENLSETLTQTAPSNPIDLPSAFSEFLEQNPDYHRKILLYEPIWLEELQKKLKENFKKHFKMSDLMDYLDQQCITFRSAAQVKNTQRKLEKQKFRRKKAC